MFVNKSVKNLFVAVSVSVAFSGAFAQNNRLDNGVQQECIAQAKMAESIMRMYQNGTTVVELVTATDKNASEIDPSVREYVVNLYKSTVYMAAEKPRYSSPTYQQRAISEFSNATMMSCLKSHSVK